MIYDIIQEKLQPFDDKRRCHATSSAFGIFDFMKPEERDLDLLFSQLTALSRRYRARSERTKSARGGYGGKTVAGIARLRAIGAVVKDVAAAVVVAKAVMAEKERRTNVRSVAF